MSKSMVLYFQNCLYNKYINNNERFKIKKKKNYLQKHESKTESTEKASMDNT